MASSSPPSAPRRRRRLVGVSTKMYFSYAQTLSYVSSVLSHLSLSPSPLHDLVDIFIIPDHITLSAVATLLKPTPILPGAQDAHHEDRGAVTGAVSPAVLSEAGCRVLEIGHAERRRLFGETDDIVARKAVAAVRNGLVPLICIGEVTRPGDGEGAAAAVNECKPQIETVLSALPDSADVILAYEPVWAIGAPTPAHPAHVIAVARGIRALDCVRRRAEGATRIVYGGSAGPGLFEKFVKGGAEGEEGQAVDGLFLGRFAHDPEQFVRTIREVAEA